MFTDKLKKYRPYPTVHLPDRTWPDKTITQAPIWCSVDLRDGNQALVQPMNLEEKLEMFQLLVDIGFKEIEVGFPAASRIEHDFTRLLIERDLVPDDVLIQTLTQSREPLIRKTFEALKGARQAVVHLYNSTSTLQRQVVFGMEKKEIIDLAVRGAEVIREEAARTDTDIRYEYSPESFTGTELDFALEICEAVMEVWEPTPQRPVIINLPATVEMSTPNVYADQIEWFIRHLKNRDCALISLHAHNDRGTAVAATELALMAGGDRVEGTLFGNGERTGNVDIMTVALNMFTQGVDPKLDFSDINRVIDVYQRCTKLPVHPRHPYAGELVYTAFSGSHQDAINKGMAAVEKDNSGIWAVPYLPIDPQDVGRTYESIIRINSQSGKGGVAYVMDKEFGFKLPKDMHPEFGAIIQKISDEAGGELPGEVIYHTFDREYLQADSCYKLRSFNVLKRHIDHDEARSSAEVEAVIEVHGEEKTLRAAGNGPLDAFCQALREGLGLQFTLQAYHEHALTRGSSAKAVSYIMVTDGEGRPFWGAGVDTDIIVASIKALLSALNRACRKHQEETT
ncbi:2-isopropylmalate synthase [Desulfolithobacter dissulfuricans]|uniref:2-isopropylmalate synthase n=1 Tax=Desulfolithobacter dissulfuricans TaxID=2795293 RepID=A0A915U9X1_9BACT|nr:2-isopropylmalate synthase [Desulfolithobacter dissulfuricans]BCO09381.1 2-isopropylmalate synthase [Desulfolithobacter dissulfuricans]